jgi:hypothetical protein
VWGESGSSPERIRRQSWQGCHLLGKEEKEKPEG